MIEIKDQNNQRSKTTRSPPNRRPVAATTNGSRRRLGCGRRTPSWGSEWPERRHGGWAYYYSNGKRSWKLRVFCFIWQNRCASLCCFIFLSSSHCQFNDILAISAQPIIIYHRYFRSNRIPKEEIISYKSIHNLYALKDQRLTFSPIPQFDSFATASLSIPAVSSMSQSAHAALSRSLSACSRPAQKKDADKAPKSARHSPARPVRLPWFSYNMFESHRWVEACSC